MPKKDEVRNTYADGMHIPFPWKDFCLTEKQKEALKDSGIILERILVSNENAFAGKDRE